MNEIKRIKLFINETEKAQNAAVKVKEALEKESFEIVEENYDLAIAVGGDGAFLRMVNKANFNSQIFYVGVNAGTLGFAQEIEVNEIEAFVQQLKHHTFSYEEVGIGEIQVRTKEDTFHFKCLNEISIRDEELNVAGLEIYVNDSLLETYIGDGLLISTSFGSTAYNLSYGGAIVYNAIHCLQITPIAPIHNKTYRSLRNSVVIPDTKKIRLYPIKGHNLIITADGENTVYKDVEEITMTICKDHIKLIRESSDNFTKKINDKFLK